MDKARDCFDKPVWTLGNLLRALPDMPRHLVRVLPTLADRVLSNALRERIMLAVAAANRCRYCKATHGILGKLAGMTDKEVRCILAGNEDGRPEGERLAIRFARDLAERNFQSRNEELYRRLGEFFNERQRAAIESTAHVMNFVNRFGNTFDSTLLRLQGGCVETEAAFK